MGEPAQLGTAAWGTADMPGVCGVAGLEAKAIPAGIRADFGGTLNPGWGYGFSPSLGGLSR